MKLGDNMTAVEACCVWRGSSRRRNRPPKIGDIPKHIAVDEEPQNQKSSPPENSFFISSKDAGKDIDCNNSSDNSPLELLDLEPGSSQYKISDRKDSALCLDKEQVNFEELGDRPNFRAFKIARPRRESSGYSSAIGTFDEDRRNSSCAEIFQDLYSSRERRRSSTKRGLRNVGEENVDRRMPVTELLGRFSSGAYEMPDIQETGDHEAESLVDEKDKELLRKLKVLGPSVSVEEEGKGEESMEPLLDAKTDPGPKKTPPESQKSSSSSDDSRNTVILASTGVSVDEFQETQLLPRSVKLYQLLSTQSEDRDDMAPRPPIRRISLQISRHEDEDERAVKFKDYRKVAQEEQGKLFPPASFHPRSPTRKLSSPGEVESSDRSIGDPQGLDVRPIYPYCPYSPYGSPQGSPGARRRPLRESRRVSIDNRQGALQLNQYKLLHNIGQGSYGIVKLVFNEEDETHYAMKILSKKKLMKKAGIFGRMAPGRKGASNPLAKVYREIALLKKLDHPNVVKLVEVLDDPDEDNLYLVFELIQRGEVLQVPTEEPLNEETARKYFRDVVMGVEYLHYQRIVHRDIKPSNLLVDGENRVKLADLGVSAELRATGELLTGSTGTPAFAAPETSTPGAFYSGTPCDIWSMGVTLYSLVIGRVPWDGSGSIIGVQVAVRSEPLQFPEKPSISKGLKTLISRMLAKEPDERITLPEIKSDSWLTRLGNEPLPSEEENCRLPITVTDEEVARVVTRVPKLDTLILIKTMLKQHSFQNPFLSRRLSKTTSPENVRESLDFSPVDSGEISGAKRKTEAFHRSGRSLSAPDSYDWQTNGRQVSVESSLPPLAEISSQETEPETR